MRVNSWMWLMLMAGCQGPSDRQFPDKVAPLEPNLAPPVGPVNGNPYPEGVMSFVCGEETEPEAYHCQLSGV